MKDDVQARRLTHTSTGKVRNPLASALLLATSQLLVEGRHAGFRGPTAPRKSKKVKRA